MKTWWLMPAAGGLMLLGAFAEAPAPAQTAPTPVPESAQQGQRVLTQWTALGIQLQNVGEALDKYRSDVTAEQSAAAAAMASAEAQKATLIEWLKQAQAQAGAIANK